jgi:serine protease SohB
MEILADYLIFLLKVFTIAVAITVPLLLIIGSSKGQSQSRGKLSITNLSDKYEDMGNAIKSSLMNPKELKKFNKNLSKEKKKKEKNDKEGSVFVFEFFHLRSLNISFKIKNKY